ncbi:mitochondrial import inner membrane translocase subunit Tim29-like [Sycon ciliatum]|uniref:mitochondrial import inner membrane translocase subunit Tim29-like n=1 Tax=Sycon ciliatum TaxID=27933 RepID=UPI0020AC40D9|eukprot:scpid86954/ scgid10394/ Uncharacterized protein C19orf52
MAARISSIVRNGWISIKNRVRTVALDYRDVAIDVADGSRKRPLRAIIISSGLLTTLHAFRTHPDKQDYLDALLRGANDVALVAESSRNKCAVEALMERRVAVNSGKLRVKDMIFFTLIHADPTQSEGCELYSCQSKLVRPPLLGWQSYFLDIGLFGRWLVLERRLERYDVNEDDLD